jgi:diaminohydroxyphosphoribosylaminopyrimidine deaminase / 5-amino-6-(5-phosphoribosylamino)uracil reductase
MTPLPATDSDLMARALRLAEQGMYTTTPNPRVGCVVARGAQILGEGWHERTGEAHAEVRALADARERGNDPRGATAYVTLEPCNHHGRTPPCTEALLTAGIGRVVAAMRDPNPQAGRGADRLRAAGVEVDIGLREDEARDLNPGWIKRMQTGKPWLRLKIAASLDGRTALQNGTSQWITGAVARADGHRWRARACAILTGIGTVRQDDPRLTVRDVATSRQPLKVVVDRHAEMASTARLLSDGAVLVFSAVAPKAPWPPHVQSQILPDGNGRIDLAAMLDVLGRRGINEVQVEAGAKLNGALLAAGLADELLIYLAPCLFGDPARGMLDRAVPIAGLDERVRLQVRDVAPVGEDWRIVARILPESA